MHATLFRRAHNNEYALAIRGTDDAHLWLLGIFGTIVVPCTLLPPVNGTCGNVHSGMQMAAHALWNAIEVCLRSKRTTADQHALALMPLDSTMHTVERHSVADQYQCEGALHWPFIRRSARSDARHDGQGAAATLGRSRCGIWCTGMVPAP